jgi:YVTN family beta-propeller protein
MSSEVKQMLQASTSQIPGQGVIATVPVDLYPSGVAYNQRTNTIYVATQGPNPAQPGTVYVIDAHSYAVVAKIPVVNSAIGVAVNSANDMVYVTVGRNTVSVINGTTNTVTATINLPSSTNALYLAVNPNTNQIYVSEELQNTVAVINGATNQIVANVPVGGHPDGIAVFPATNRIYVANAYSNNVSVIDGNNYNVVATMLSVGGPFEVAVNPNTSQVYVTNNFSVSTISVFNATTNVLSGTIQLDNRPFGIAVDPTRNLLYVATHALGTFAGAIEVIRLADNTLIRNISVCNGPYDIALDYVRNFAYVSNQDSNTISVIGNDSLASRLSLSASTTTSFVGFVVTATGTLTGWNVTTQTLGPLQGGTITLVFVVQNGTYNQSLNIQTDRNGRFSAQWIPTLTGNYLITAYRPETSCQTSSVSVSVLPVGNQYVFSVASNSTVSALTFNGTSAALAFQLSGPTGQTALVDVSIAKSLLSSVGTLRILANSIVVPFNSTDTGQSWVVSFRVHFGAFANVVMQLQGVSTPNGFNYEFYLLLSGIGLAAGMGAYLIFRKSGEED